MEKTPKLELDEEVKELWNKAMTPKPCILHAFSLDDGKCMKCGKTEEELRELEQELNRG